MMVFAFFIVWHYTVNTVLQMEYVKVNVLIACTEAIRIFSGKNIGGIMVPGPCDALGGNSLFCFFCFYFPY